MKKREISLVKSMIPSARMIKKEAKKMAEQKIETDGPRILNEIKNMIYEAMRNEKQSIILTSSNLCFKPLMIAYQYIRPTLKKKGYSVRYVCTFEQDSIPEDEDMIVISWS